MREQNCGAFIFVLLLFFVISTPTSTLNHDISASFFEKGISVRSYSNLTSHAPINITSNGDFASQGWSGNGTIDSPYIIERLNITLTSNPAIRIKDANVHFIIRNCFLSGDIDSVQILVNFENVSNGLISGCTIARADTGIRVDASYNLTIKGNSIKECWYGVFLIGSHNIVFRNDTFTDIHRGAGIGLESVTNSEVSQCLFIDSEHGVIVESSTKITFSQNIFANTTNGIIASLMGNSQLMIHHNQFLNSSGSGILVGSMEPAYAAPNPGESPPQIYTRIENNNFNQVGYAFGTGDGAPVLFSNNTIKNCGIGVGLGCSKGNQIINNSITNSIRYGIWLLNAHLNTLYNNLVVNSGVSNAIDDSGFSNIWDNGIDTGNVWDDYNGTINYTINGTSNSTDRWPKRHGPPFIWAPLTFETIEGQKQSLVWWAYDSNPSVYEIWLNGVLLVTEPWDGQNISVPLDNLEQGTNNITVRVYDQLDGKATCSCMVMVYPNEDLGLLMASGVIIAVILSLVVIYYRHNTQ